MDYIIDFFEEIWFFIKEISLYLLLGFFIAGVLHVIFPESVVRRHLGTSSLGSVVKSTVFGIPLPLCSCGVVPVAASLRKSGASKGSTVSFLISTPQIGADSFMITYSLLGWVFALFRIVASFITALVAGILVNIFSRGGRKEKSDTIATQKTDEKVFERLRMVFRYVEYDLLGSIATPLVIGIIIAGLIGVVVPEDFFEEYLGDQFLSMILMLVVGIPMYVCAAASTPIAASLIMKGLSPGAALVFLLTGPATNAMSISTVMKIVGKKSTAIYLATIALVALGLGFLLNSISSTYGIDKVIMHHEHGILPEWSKIVGSVVILTMIAWYYFNLKVLSRWRVYGTKEGEAMVRLNVNGMTCMHCAGNVKKAVESVEGTSNVNVDLDDKAVKFDINDSDLVDEVKKRINDAGYEV